jgi:site-specific DNA-adenine methylase
VSIRVIRGKKIFSIVVDMMSDLEQNIKRINDKLQQLLKNYQLLQKENSRQAELIRSLQQEKLKDEEIISELRQKVMVLKAVTGKMNEADKKAFEKNISRYIREIDKCIGILSE